MLEELRQSIGEIFAEGDKTTRGIFLWLLVMAPGISGFLCLSIVVFSVIKSDKSTKWGRATAEIVDADLGVNKHESEDGSVSYEYHPNVQYDYEWNGLRYQGDRIAFGYNGSHNRAKEIEVLDKLRKGKTVRIWVNQGKPEQSTIVAGILKSTHQENTPFFVLGLLFSSISLFGCMSIFHKQAWLFKRIFIGMIVFMTMTILYIVIEGENISLLDKIELVE